MKNSVKFSLVGASIAIAGVLLFFNISTVDASETENSEIEIPEGCTRLVFADEFEVNGAPDSTKWTPEIGYVRNGELQYYTDGKNAWCENSILHIQARADSTVIDGKMCPVSSASLTTKGLKGWKYGYVEVRAQLPSFRGSWPAIWMMPTNDTYGGWPRSGEIDIMEHVGYEPENVHFAAHSERYNHIRGVQKNKASHAPDCTEGFHIYGFRHTPDKLVWYYDGEEKFSVDKEKDADWTSWPFDEDFYLILNLAVGGGWGGYKGVDISALPAEYLIDYVRVFE